MDISENQTTVGGTSGRSLPQFSELISATQNPLHDILSSNNWARSKELHEVPNFTSMHATFNAKTESEVIKVKLLLFFAFLHFLINAY